MTTQPHFVPNEAVEIHLRDSATLKVRMVDCVGYLVKNAIGYLEDGAPRMVRTPWFDEDIPFEEAAEIGTRKVISEHSTIGFVVITDGSISELPRSSYLEAEERVIEEMKAQRKPFIILLNSIHPEDDETQKLAYSLQEKYDVQVKCVNVERMELANISELLEMILFEFPLTQVMIELPSWMQVLPMDHWLMDCVLNCVRQGGAQMTRVRDFGKLAENLSMCEHPILPQIDALELGTGIVHLGLHPESSLYYRILGEICGMEVRGEDHLLMLLREMSEAKREYDRVADALRSVRETGYGLVTPTLEEMTLEEPEIVKQGTRFGVRLKASAPSLHLMRVDIETEVSPVVGTEKQSEELVKYLLSGFENDPAQIWNTNIFGKSLHELVKEGLSNKLMRMPEDAQIKISETLQRIINEGSGGLICILL